MNTQTNLSDLDRLGDLNIEDAHNLLSNTLSELSLWKEKITKQNEEMRELINKINKSNH